MKEEERRLKETEERRVKEEAKRLKEEERRLKQEEEKRIKEEERKLREEEKRRKDEDKKMKEAEERRCKEQEQKEKKKEIRNKEIEKKQKEEEKRRKEWEERKNKEEGGKRRKAEEQRKQEERAAAEQEQREQQHRVREQQLRERENDLLNKSQKARNRLKQEAETRLQHERERIQRELQRKQEAKTRRLEERLAKIEQEKMKAAERSAGGGSLGTISINSNTVMASESAEQKDATVFVVKQQQACPVTVSSYTDSRKTAENVCGISITDNTADKNEHPRMLSSVGNTDDELLLQIESASMHSEPRLEKKKVLLSRRLRDTRSKLKQLRCKAVERLRELLPDGSTQDLRSNQRCGQYKYSLPSSTVQSTSYASDSELIHSKRKTMIIQDQQVPPPRPPPPSYAVTSVPLVRRIKETGGKSEPSLDKWSHRNYKEQYLTGRPVPPPRPPPPSLSRLTISSLETSALPLEEVSLQDDECSLINTTNTRLRTPAERYYRELLAEWCRKNLMANERNNSPVANQYSKSTPNVAVRRSESCASSRILYDDYRYRLRRKAVARKASIVSKTPTEPGHPFHTSESKENGK